ncbi:mucin-associated surface protein (MASP), partial [Trypanosoma cruzi]
MDGKVCVAVVVYPLLLLLCVDGALVCAEGYTQVTGVMAMMTGRVLLVCALCVLWCGAGGRCDEEMEAAAGGAGGGIAGKGAVEPAGTSTPAADSSSLTKGLPRVNQSKETRGVKPLEVKEVNADQQDVVPGVEDEDGIPSEQLEETVNAGPGKENTKTQLKNVGQEVRQPPEAQFNLPQQPQPQTPASEKGEGAGENNKGGAGQPSLGVQDIGNEDSKALGKGDLLKSPGKESESSEQVQTTVQKTVPPEHKTQNEVLTSEQKTNESQSTDTSNNLPETQKENKEYPASTKGTAQSTSIGSQEQEAEPSTSEEPSPFEEQQFTGTNTTEDARTPDAAATEKSQS